MCQFIGLNGVPYGVRGGHGYQISLHLREIIDINTWDLFLNCVFNFNCALIVKKKRNSKTGPWSSLQGKLKLKTKFKNRPQAANRRRTQIAVVFLAIFLWSLVYLRFDRQMPSSKRLYSRMYYESSSFLNLQIPAYKRLHDMPNSVTILPDILPLLLELLQRRYCGTLNMTNPDVVRHSDTLEP